MAVSSDHNKSSMSIPAKNKLLLLLLLFYELLQHYELLVHCKLFLFYELLLHYKLFLFHKLKKYIVLLILPANVYHQGMSGTL